MAFQLTPNVHVRRDKDGVVRLLRHMQEPYGPAAAALVAPTPRAMAGAYLRDVAPIYAIDPKMLADLDKPVGQDLTDAGTLLQLAAERTTMDTTTASYQQTHFGVPIWEAGFAVRLHGPDLRVTSSQSSIHYDVQVQKPKPDVKFLPPSIDSAVCAEILRLKKGVKDPRVNRIRPLIYRYDPAMRFDPESKQDEGPLQAGPPTLPLPEVPKDIKPGQHYIVTEVLFTLTLPGEGELNWRAFIEPKTGAVLYLRAFVAYAFGNVFDVDPLTKTGDPTITPASPGTTLDPLTALETLVGLTAPANPGDPQELTGDFVQVMDIGAPAIEPPTAALPAGNFSKSAVTNEFAAVNAYRHCDGLFRLVQGMGFDISTYFDGTTFPVRVDHRDLGDIVNAQAPGNATGDGSDGFRFALCEVGAPVGIAADKRVVLHEFGHALLWDNVNSPNFGFSHSAGDSLAVILCDPGSLAPDRFLTFPWITAVPRRHDRDVTAGWAWGGTNDVGGYSSEQILSTTHFRTYRSTGGDDNRRHVQEFAARYLAYLIVRATGSLTPETNPSDPDDWATALMDADTGTLSFEGHPGGAFHKVIRWGFEKQGLYQPVGAPTPTPVTSEGDPPEVDVYINDGRDGEYSYKRNFWNTQDMWNRLSADGGTTHQTPVVGVTNYMYVRVKNRGTQTANNVLVKAYHCIPAAGLVWPDDWQAMTTPQLPASGPIPSGGETIVGPFEWTPEVVGHECLLASVSADGDLSNADTVNGPIPHWRLVPFDNNIAQRNLAPVPGGGGLSNLVLAFLHRRFVVRNPFDRTVQVIIEASIPDFLRQRKWDVRFLNRGGASFTLGPRASREVELSLIPGEDFLPSDVEAAGEGAVIEFETLVDGLPVGGMSYAIDPKMKTPAAELPEDIGKPDCSEEARRLLRCLNVPADEVKSVRLKRITVDIDLKEDC